VAAGSGWTCFFYSSTLIMLDTASNWLCMYDEKKHIQLFVGGHELRIGGLLCALGFFSLFWLWLWFSCLFYFSKYMYCNNIWWSFLSCTGVIFNLHHFGLAKHVFCCLVCGALVTIVIRGLQMSRNERRACQHFKPFLLE
jgi:hypothetical protein